MGAWGIGPFENDDASDWCWSLTEAPDLERARSVLRLPDVAYLDARDASIAIAASEIVAAALGAPMSGLADDLAEWVSVHAGAATGTDAALARSAIDRVLGKGSELAELWDESPSADEWRARVNELRQRLAAFG